MATATTHHSDPNRSVGGHGDGANGVTDEAVDVYQEMLEDLQHETEGLRAECTKLEGELDDERARNEDLSETNRELHETIAALKAEKATILTSAKASRDMVANVRASLLQVENEVTKKQAAGGRGDGGTDDPYWDQLHRSTKLWQEAHASITSSMQRCDTTFERPPPSPRRPATEARAKLEEVERERESLYSLIHQLRERELSIRVHRNTALSSALRETNENRLLQRMLFRWMKCMQGRRHTRHVRSVMVTGLLRGADKHHARSRFETWLQCVDRSRRSTAKAIIAASLLRLTQRSIAVATFHKWARYRVLRMKWHRAARTSASLLLRSRIVTMGRVFSTLLRWTKQERERRVLRNATDGVLGRASATAHLRLRFNTLLHFTNAKRLEHTNVRAVQALAYNSARIHTAAVFALWKRHRALRKRRALQLHIAATLLRKNSNERQSTVFRKMLTWARWRQRTRIQASAAERLLLSSRRTQMLLRWVSWKRFTQKQTRAKETTANADRIASADKGLDRLLDAYEGLLQDVRELRVSNTQAATKRPI